MRNPPHVALLIESSREYGRGLLRGVARWARERLSSKLLLGPRSMFHGGENDFPSRSYEMENHPEPNE